MNTWSDVSLRARTNPSPSPFVLESSQLWDGNDGSWSTFLIRVGTPAQTFRILPATNGQETWVPVPQGCLSSDPISCGNLRGVEPFKSAPSSGFQSNASSTWVENGFYTLVSERNLNYSGNGKYGFDTVKLGIQHSALSLTGQVVAGIATKDFYLGVFGLGPKPANFTDFTDPKPSYMRNLVDRHLIPSLSFGYTAGASYRLKKVLGSLTLGGYDSSRFTANNLTFSFASDDSRSLTIGLQSITASNTLQGGVTPLTSGILSLIDSTIPHIWLPTKACSIFEEAFGLTYDARTELYLVNDTIHAKLQQLNPIVTFKIGNSVSGGDSLSIELPYLAFDLQASSPIYPTAKNYFPLRRASNDTQYTLGRTFLQEAYVIVDYERSNFSVSQALFKDPNPQQIVTIDSVSSGDNSTSTFSNSSSRVLSRGTTAGIIIGAAAAFLLIILTAIYFFRKYNSKRSTERRWNSTALKRQIAKYRKAELPADEKFGKVELAADEESGKFELAADEESGKFELASNEKFELAANDQNVIPELDSRGPSGNTPRTHISIPKETQAHL